MSNTVIAMAVFLFIVVACCFYLDLRFVLPFIQRVSTSYGVPKEDEDDEMKINNIGLYIIQVTMIFAFIVMGFQIPTRLVLACAGLGVGEKVFMLGFQAVVEYKGYKKAGKTEGAEATKVESTESKAEEKKSTEQKSKGTDTDEEVKPADEESIESEVKEESKGIEPEVKTEEEVKSDESKVEDTKVTDSEPKSEGTPDESPTSDKGTEDVHTNEAEIKK